MKCIAVLLMSFVTICCAAPTSKPDYQLTQSFVLTNINVVDVEAKRIHSNQTLVVDNGTIAQIADTSIAEQHDQFADHLLIDGKNGYVTPGLIDMHVHIYEPAAYLMTLSHGVTHVRIMNGIPAQLRWQRAIAAGELVGSSSSVSSPIISGYDDALLHHAAHTAEQARQAVRQYHDDGYDLIKAYGNLNQSALIALVAEARKLNIAVAKHGPHGSGDMTLAELAGLQSFEHVEDIFQGPMNYQFDPHYLDKAVAAISKTQVPVTPTLNIFDQLTQLSQGKQAYLDSIPTRYTPDIIAFEASGNQVKRWLDASEAMANHNQRVLEFLLFITKKLKEMGVPLLVGSDSGVLLSPHGLATHNEMALMQRAGLSSFDVLQAATINAAKALKMEHQLGRIALGNQADFIYSQVNPIDDLSALKEPDAVIKNGHWYSHEQLVAMREQAIEERSIWREIRVLFEAI